MAESAYNRQMIANRSIPSCTVIPQLAYPDVGQAADWLCDAFGFSIRLRIGNHRVQLNVGDGAVVVTEDGTGGTGARDRHSPMVRVENVDNHCEQARSRGARILREPADYPYGERQYTVADVAGHVWTFTQSIADVDPREWGGEPGAL
jgi:uncharacterized glyoxalase superfamily protein PhnB